MSISKKFEDKTFHFYLQDEKQRTLNMIVFWMEFGLTMALLALYRDGRSAKSFYLKSKSTSTRV